MGDEVVAEPGDTIHVTEDAESDADAVVDGDVEGDVNDVDVEDHSFNTDTDESVNVNVVVEAPEATDNGSDDVALQTLELLRSIDAKLDRTANATEVSAITDVADELDEGDEHDGADVVDLNATGDDAPVDVKDEPVEDAKPKRTRRFGR